MNGIALIKRTEVWLPHTLCFFAFSALIIAIYAAAGKSFVWWDDGMYQHVNSLAYYGKNICARSFRVFLHGDFEVPMFSLSIGYGADIAATLNYYVFGDPFSFLRCLSPSGLRKFFNVLIFVRLYLCGLVFCVFLRHRGRKSVPAVLSGSLIYAFADICFLRA